MFVQIQPAVRSQIHIQHLITKSPTPTSDPTSKEIFHEFTSGEISPLIQC